MTTTAAQRRATECFNTLQPDLKIWKTPIQKKKRKKMNNERAEKKTGTMQNKQELLDKEKEYDH